MDVEMTGTIQMCGASCLLSVHPDMPDDKVRVLSHLTTNKRQRGKGNGSKLLQRVCNKADEAGIILILTPHAYGDISLTNDKLIEWYTRHGFETIQQDPILMMRPVHE